MEKNIEVSITMYPVGELGDCFLLNFSNEEFQSSVLIDSGSFRNGEKSVKRMRAIAEHIKNKQNKGDHVKPIDLVVGTHQHLDHVSNFVHSKDIFTSIGMDNLWLSWLDDPKDDHATRIANGERKLARKLEDISHKLSVLAGVKDGQSAQRINDILGFYGLDKQSLGQPPVVPQQAVNNLKEIAKKTKYLKPGQLIDLPGLPKGLVKVYVLGPPVDNNLLFDINPSKGESYEFRLAEAMNDANSFLSALTNFNDTDSNIDEPFFPFNREFNLSPDNSRFLDEHYNIKEEEWRKIEEDWYSQAERLALYLDSYTNNSSLVLAFEIVKTKKVLLFVGDAQTGNWLSWKTINWKASDVSLDQLLKNTVLYKVGHHCSHNATLPEYLEKMTNNELVAMIPVDITDPNIKKDKGWKMPAANLYKRIKKATNNRILRMDNVYESDSQIEGDIAAINWGSLLNNLHVESNTAIDGKIITYKIQ